MIEPSSAAETSDTRAWIRRSVPALRKTTWQPPVHIAESAGWLRRRYAPAAIGRPLSPVAEPTSPGHRPAQAERAGWKCSSGVDPGLTPILDKGYAADASVVDVVRRVFS